MKRLNITDTILDKLGFSEYWDEHCVWGGRTLEFSNGTRFRIIEQAEMDDDTEGYGDGEYIAHSFYFTGWFAIPKFDPKIQDSNSDLFFLHEMYECLEKFYPDCIEEFTAKCKALKMGKYIDSFLEHRKTAST